MEYYLSKGYESNYCIYSFNNNGKAVIIGNYDTIENATIGYPDAIRQDLIMIW